MIPKPKTLPNGLVIVFEGIDGSGKSTQLGLLENALKAAGWSVEVIRNPGGTPIGEALREVFLSPIERPAMTDLYTSMAIQESIIEAIKVARQAGKIILLDRGPFSQAAYQIYGAGIDAQKGWDYVDQGVERIAAEATIVFKANVEDSLKRARAQSNSPDYFESKPLDYFNKVAEGYEACAERYNITPINADRSIEDVYQDTERIISKLLA